jgi:hypothetical protein
MPWDSRATSSVLCFPLLSPRKRGDARAACSPTAVLAGAVASMCTTSLTSLFLPLSLLSFLNFELQKQVSYKSTLSLGEREHGKTSEESVNRARMKVGVSSIAGSSWADLQHSLLPARRPLYPSAPAERDETAVIIALRVHIRRRTSLNARNNAHTTRFLSSSLQGSSSSRRRGTTPTTSSSASASAMRKSPAMKKKENELCERCYEH